MTMDRADAFKTLCLDESADAPLIEAAYWALVRKAQDRSSQATDAHLDIDLLNEAYQTLKPGSAPPLRHESPAPGAPPVELLDRIADWIDAEAQRTRARWAGRNVEIGVIAAASVFLAGLSVAEGASFGVALFFTLLIATMIWAPWRAVGAPEPPAVSDATPAEPPAPPVVQAKPVVRRRAKSSSV